MDESRSNDHTRAEVLRDEEGPFRNAQASVPFCKDGEDRTYAVLKYDLEHDTVHLPSVDPRRITKMDETRMPMRPS